MIEEFVPFNIATQLKEKGFKFNNDYRLDRFFMANGINIPTISQVLKWLRDKHKLHVDIAIWGCKYIAMIVYIDIKDENIVHCNKTICMEDNDKYDSYEEAAIAGITYTLDNLI